MTRLLGLSLYDYVWHVIVYMAPLYIVNMKHWTTEEFPMMPAGVALTVNITWITPISTTIWHHIPLCINWVSKCLSLNRFGWYPTGGQWGITDRTTPFGELNLLQPLVDLWGPVCDRISMYMAHRVGKLLATHQSFTHLASLRYPVWLGWNSCAVI